MVTVVLGLIVAAACPAADEAERTFDYPRAYRALEGCLAGSHGRERATLLLRQGILKAEMHDDDGARALFRHALDVSAAVTPPAKVSPKIRALFDEVRAAHRPPAPPPAQPEPPASPPPAAAPVVVEAPAPASAPTTLRTVGWWTLGAGAAVTLAGPALYGLVYVPGVNGLRERLLIDAPDLVPRAGLSDMENARRQDQLAALYQERHDHELAPVAVTAAVLTVAGLIVVAGGVGLVLSE